MADTAPEPDANPETASDSADEAAAGTTEPEVSTDPDEVMKQKFREAIAHKHGTSGATKQEHGDSGSSGHSQSAGPSQRMFRRKAGG
jgi:hypothetical protein